MLLLTYQCGYTFVSESWLTRMICLLSHPMSRTVQKVISNNPMKTTTRFWSGTLHRPINFLFFWTKSRFYKSDTSWKEQPNQNTVRPCPYEAQAQQIFSFHNSNIRTPVLITPGFVFCYFYLYLPPYASLNKPLEIFSYNLFPICT